MISINNISVRFSGVSLFENLSFLINPNDRIGLVGINGAGKSTIMKILMRLIETETGEIVEPSDITYGYLPQEMAINSQKSVYEEALTAFSELNEIEDSIAKLNMDLSIREDYESKKYLKLIDQLTIQNERFQLLGGDSAQADVEKVLKGLGFVQQDMDRCISELSDGWQMRIELAKILLRKPMCLLLDEPTNHLDIESIQWLEDYLINYYGAIIVISHDRAFLDHITKRTVEISIGRLYDYKTSYSDYVKLREERLEQQQASYNNQQKEIQQVEKFIERFRYKDSKAKQVQSKVKLLQKMDRVEVDNIDRSAIHFKFPSAPPSGKITIETDNLSKKYDDNLVLNEVNFIALKGERIAFVGKNGEGKSTLSKIIAGVLDYTGSLKLGHNVSIGYYAQNQWDMLDGNKTVFETIDDVAVGDVRTKIRTILGSFMFSNDAIDKKVKVLSGGEKSRLSLAKLLLNPVNLLILDEPTNHLDMRSKDILKNALLMFEGTLIIVSHDRDFMQGLTTKIIEFRNKELKEHLGDIYDFLRKRKLENLKELEEAKKKSQLAKEGGISVNKVKYNERKQIEKDFRKLKTQIKNCEIGIENLEQEIKLMDSKLSRPEEYQKEIASGELYKFYDELKLKVDEQMKLWEDLQIKAEFFQEQQKNFNNLA